MTWNQERITAVAKASASADFLAFEAIGLSEIDGARILDVGCFDGYNTVLKFAAYEDAAQIVGIDPEAAMIDQARQRTDDPRFTWTATSFEDFQDESQEGFDLVYFSHVFQHLPNKQDAARKAFDLLNPGGFCVIKTVDDSTNISSPDPQNLMRRLYALYDEHVLPNTPHTRNTDRNNGSKCYGLLKDAGFNNVAVRTLPSDTANKTPQERAKLFERLTYYRKNVPDCVDPGIADQIRDLLDAWSKLFLQDDYYFASQTFVVIAQKPLEGSQTRYEGPLFQQATPGISGETGPQKTWMLRPMVESDLGQVMDIEIRSFPDPWTPVAYAMELRYNTRAAYTVAVSAEGRIGGYVGSWEADGMATIANIATDPRLRRSGIGRMLIDHACDQAHEHGCAAMQLQVRAQNETARSFYAAMGFNEMGLSQGYYTNPDDDAVILVRMLG
ncbi:MAG: ribosomal protein S18-alanine N-acetyltransferase [Coriobacteriia bacterium]|nr:ribosomal protein S18-alanine N-acetyltransferase [Coriobacteriia bacterium]